MKNVAYFNTAISSLNVGDYIINGSAKDELSDVLAKSFVAEFPTHSPVVHAYQCMARNKLIRFTDSCDYKFVVGTNILAYNYFRPWPNWNVNIFNARPYKNSILVGVGSNQNSDKVNAYTRHLYKKILSKSFVHSTRDEKTKILLNDLGFEALNTGCITLWNLPSIQIPTSKSDNVVFTLTDYAKDKKSDSNLISLLKKSYKNVYFWPQGSGDLLYANELGIDGVIVLPANLNSFKNVLENGELDYVGTRLHGGVFAMKHNVRSIILAVDHRAIDMKHNYDLNIVNRESLESIEKKIHSSFETKINLDQDKIKEWKSQFK